MSDSNVALFDPSKQKVDRNEDVMLLSVMVSDHTVGLPILSIRDIIKPQNIAPIPLARSEILGSLNLRGNIVTVIDMNSRMDFSDEKRDPHEGMNVVVEHANEFFSLFVDSVDDVISVPSAALEAAPSTLNPAWREFVAGVVRCETTLMTVIDIPSLLDGTKTLAA